MVGGVSGIWPTQIGDMLDLCGGARQVLAEALAAVRCPAGPCVGPFRKIVTAITAAPNACWQTDHAKLLRRGTTWSFPKSVPSRLSDALTSPSHVPLPRYPTRS